MSCDLTYDEVWAPLERVAERVVERVDIPLVLPCQFMFMYHDDHPGLPRIFVYKHKHSRLCLNIAANGRFAEYVGDGEYVLTRAHLKTVIRSLEIDDWTDWTIGDGYCDGCVLLMERRLSAEVTRAL